MMRSRGLLLSTLLPLIGAFTPIAQAADSSLWVVQSGGGVAETYAAPAADDLQGILTRGKVASFVVANGSDSSTDLGIIGLRVEKLAVQPDGSLAAVEIKSPADLPGDLHVIRRTGENGESLAGTIANCGLNGPGLLCAAVFQEGPGGDFFTPIDFETIEPWGTRDFQVALEAGRSSKGLFRITLTPDLVLTPKRALTSLDLLALAVDESLYGEYFDSATGSGFEHLIRVKSANLNVEVSRPQNGLARHVYDSVTRQVKEYRYYANTRYNVTIDFKREIDGNLSLYLCHQNGNAMQQATAANIEKYCVLTQRIKGQPRRELYTFGGTFSSLRPNIRLPRDYFLGATNDFVLLATAENNNGQLISAGRSGVFTILNGRFISSPVNFLAKSKDSKKKAPKKKAPKKKKKSKR